MVTQKYAKEKEKERVFCHGLTVKGINRKFMQHYTFETEKGATETIRSSVKICVVYRKSQCYKKFFLI